MILFLHQGAIGDFLLCLSVLQPLWELFGRPELRTISTSSAAPFSAGRSIITRAVEPESVAFHRLFAEDEGEALEPGLIHLVRTADLVLSFLGDETGLPHRRLRRTGARRVVSIDPRPRPETLRDRRHITDQWADDLRTVGLPILRPAPPHLEAASAHPDRPTDTGRHVLIHPGSGGHAKCWPLERFIELADILKRDAMTQAPRQPRGNSVTNPPDMGNHQGGRPMPVHVTWMLGPAEMDIVPARFRRLPEYCRRSGDGLLVEQDLASAAAKIARADIVIGNDSGISHLAAALGRPVCVLFGPTDPNVWRPLGPHVRVAATASPGMDMTCLTVEEVRAVLSDQLPPAPV